MSIEKISEISSGHHSDRIKIRRTLPPKFYSRGVSMHTKVLSRSKHTFVYALIGAGPKPCIDAQKISNTVVLSM